MGMSPRNIYKLNQATSTQEVEYAQTEESKGLPSEVNDALEMVSYADEPLAQQSHKTGWDFLQQVYDSHNIHNKAFNAERDHTLLSDKNDDDIDFNRADHQ